MKKKPAKAKTPKARENPRSEALMSTSDLLRATGYSAPHISDMKNAGIIQSVGVGKWPAVATLGAMVRRLREKQDSSGNEDRARKNKSEADSAEMDTLAKAHKTCLMSDAKQYWSDARIEIRQVIERSPDISEIAKRRILAKIAALKTKPPEPEQ